MVGTETGGGTDAHNGLCCKLGSGVRHEFQATVFAAYVLLPRFYTTSRILTAVASIYQPYITLYPNPIP